MGWALGHQFCSARSLLALDLHTLILEQAAVSRMCQSLRIDWSGTRLMLSHHFFTPVKLQAGLEKTPGPLGWEGIVEKISRRISVHTIQFFLADIHSKYEEV